MVGATGGVIRRGSWWNDDMSYWSRAGIRVRHRGGTGEQGGQLVGEKDGVGRMLLSTFASPNCPF